MSIPNSLLWVLLLVASSQFLLGQVNSWTHYDAPDITGSNVKSLTADQRNYLWSLSVRNVSGKGYYGIGYFDGSRWTTVSSLAGFGFADTTELYDIITDKAGNVWVTGDGGISRYDGAQWHHHHVDDSLVALRKYLAIACDSSNNIWVATDAPFTLDTLFGVPYVRHYVEVFRFRGGVWETMLYADTLDSTNEFQQGRIISLCVDPAGSVWATSRQSFGLIIGGLRRYQDGEWTRYDLEDGFEIKNAKSPISAMADHNGGIWIGYGAGTIKPGSDPAPGGLSNFNNGVWYHYRDSIMAVTERNGAGSFAVDRSGTLWFGTASGVVRHDGRGMKCYRPGTDLGLSSTANNIKDIAIDQNGILWLATNKGIMRLNDRVVSVEPEREISSHDIAAYPNPVEQGMNVQLTYHSSGIIEPELQIVDILGQSYPVRPERISRSGSVVNLMVSTEGYMPGLYHIRIRGAGNSTPSIPVVITP